MLGEQPLVHAGAVVRDCRLGAWTEIGTGAVIGAGSVVTRDVGPYEIAVGAPARTVRTRFTQDVILLLLAPGWWEWDRPTLEDRWRDLCDLPRFLERHCPAAAAASPDGANS